MTNERWSRWIQLAAALGTMGLVAACGGSDDSDAEAQESDLVQEDPGPVDDEGEADEDPALTCEPAIGDCRTCAEHLANMECDLDTLCQGSVYLHDQMSACTDEHCAEECGDLHSELTQECATCALEQCNPEVSACASDKQT